MFAGEWLCYWKMLVFYDVRLGMSVFHGDLGSRIENIGICWCLVTNSEAQLIEIIILNHQNWHMP